MTAFRVPPTYTPWSSSLPKSPPDSRTPESSCQHLGSCGVIRTYEVDRPRKLVSPHRWDTGLGPGPLSDYSLLPLFFRIFPPLSSLHSRQRKKVVVIFVAFKLMKDMDTNNPAVFVNGELLSQYVGRRVRALFQIVRDEGGVLIGQSTDNRQVTIRGSLSFPVSHFVEVIGIADGNHAIRAEICTDFGEKADSVSYNYVCQMANGEFKSLFV